MSRKELNSEIQQIISNLSDDSLKSVLDFIKNAQNIDASKLELSKHLGTILKEDANLLKKLAQ